jgi:hypothetical protein
MQATITINEQAHEVYFGLMAMQLFVKSQGSLEEGDVLSIVQTKELIWAGLKNAAYDNRKPLPDSFFKEMSRAVDDKLTSDEGILEITAIYTAFAESKAVKDVAGDKKKAKKIPKAV